MNRISRPQLVGTCRGSPSWVRLPSTVTKCNGTLQDYPPHCASVNESMVRKEKRLNCNNGHTASRLVPHLCFIATYPNFKLLRCLMLIVGYSPVEKSPGCQNKGSWPQQNLSVEGASEALKGNLRTRWTLDT